MANSEEIGWDQLDMGRFAIGSTLMFLGTRTIVYPFSLVKTRLQVQQVRADSSFPIFKMKLFSLQVL